MAKQAIILLLPLCLHVKGLPPKKACQQGLSASKSCSSVFDSMCHFMPMSISANSSTDQQQLSCFGCMHVLATSLHQHDDACIAFCDLA